MWDALFDLVSALLWDPVGRRPRIAALLWIVVVVVTFTLLGMYMAGR